MTSLVRVTHGVWRPHADTDADRIVALLSACPDGTVIGGVSAALLHGLWLPPMTVTGPAEVIVHPDRPVPTSRPHGRRLEIRTRRQRLPATDVTEVDGLPVTALARTWRDLADRYALPDLVALGDSVLRAGASTDELAGCVAAGRHCRGIVRARIAVPLLDRRSRSRPESHLRCAVVTAGLPRPAVNVAIYDEYGEWLAEPDLSYEDARLALEYDGADHADPGRMRRDITREIDLTDRGGWSTVRFGPVQVFRRPDQVAQVVRRLRRERLPRPTNVEWRDNS